MAERINSVVRGMRGIPAKVRAFVSRFRNAFAIVLVSLFPVVLTHRRSVEREFAWGFSCAVLGALVVLHLSELFRRQQPGHCVRCAYDLTGNTSGVCPECGLIAREEQVGNVASILEWQ